MSGNDEQDMADAGIPDTAAAREYITLLAGDDCPWRLTEAAFTEIDRLRTLVAEQRAAIGLLVEWSLDQLPKIKASGGGAYELMPAAVVEIGRKFGPFHEGERWTEDERMPVGQSFDLFDRLDQWHAETYDFGPPIAGIARLLLRCSLALESEGIGPYGDPDDGGHLREVSPERQDADGKIWQWAATLAPDLDAIEAS